MAVQKQTLPSFASIISVLSIVFYCAGVLGVELELHEHKKRINALESVVEAKPPSNDPDIIKNAPAPKVTGNDSGVYQCSATNILGKSLEVVRLAVNVYPRVSLYPGPSYVTEGSNVTLPTCHVTGYPAPVVTWRKSSGQLPQGRAQYNNSILQISDVRKVDSDTYFCSAVNLLGNVERKTQLVVISLPAFTVKPPGKVFAVTGYTLTLNCSATGDPRPVISWKRQGAALPVGRSHRTNEALIIRDVKEEDAGNYICVATSAGVFHIETISYVEVGKPRDCSDLLKSGQTQSGLYSVNPDGRGHFTVYCDMRTDGGGWTVFQRRQDGSVDFYRGWNDYKAGFGQLTAEFWLGNGKIHRLTASRPSSLRVELEDWSGGKAYAKYGKFNIGDEQAQYRLEVGSYSGTAGDSLAYHNNMTFTTKDRDNDRRSSANCAVDRTGAWWYNSCFYSNLNGQYLENKRDWKGAVWYHFRFRLSLKFTEMKLRPSS
ncbi:tenascin-R-like [Oculina patagonica]